MNRTRIPWCDWTWNPLVGCSPASIGCSNCYAAKISKRFHLPWGSAHFLPDRLNQPANLRKPGRVFVCSMSDFYHESIDDVTRSAVMEVIGENPHHTFIILTKRPNRIPAGAPWFRNVWLGVTAENQQCFDERWHELLCRTDTLYRPVVRFVSIEPMLGPITLHSPQTPITHPNELPDWVIAGPENGPKARRCDDAWIDALAAESPCFFDKRPKWTRREFPNGWKSK